MLNRKELIKEVSKIINLSGKKYKLDLDIASNGDFVKITYEFGLTKYVNITNSDYLTVIKDIIAKI